MEDRLKLTGSVRYDKSKNFDGNFSPRVSAVYIQLVPKRIIILERHFKQVLEIQPHKINILDLMLEMQYYLGSAPDNLIDI
jgi:hypothetical protein